MAKTQLVMRAKTDGCIFELQIFSCLIYNASPCSNKHCWNTLQWVWSNKQSKSYSTFGLKKIIHILDLRWWSTFWQSKENCQLSTNGSKINIIKRWNSSMYRDTLHIHTCRTECNMVTTFWIKIYTAHISFSF